MVPHGFTYTIPEIKTVIKSNSTKGKKIRLPVGWIGKQIIIKDFEDRGPIIVKQSGNSGVVSVGFLGPAVKIGTVLTVKLVE